MAAKLSVKYRARVSSEYKTEFEITIQIWSVIHSNHFYFYNTSKENLYYTVS